jgi:hypothetical protein
VVLLVDSEQGCVGHLEIFFDNDPCLLLSI